MSTEQIREGIDKCASLGVGNTSNQIMALYEKLLTDRGMPEDEKKVRKAMLKVLLSVF